MFENAYNVDQIEDKIKQCVNIDANESEELNPNLIEEVDEVIAQASNTNEPLVYDENIKSNSKLVEMQDMHECLREEDVTILELLQQFNHNKNLPKIRNKQRK